MYLCHRMNLASDSELVFIFFSANSDFFLQIFTYARELIFLLWFVCWSEVVVVVVVLVAAAAAAATTKLVGAKKLIFFHTKDFSRSLQTLALCECFLVHNLMLHVNRDKWHTSNVHHHHRQYYYYYYCCCYYVIFVCLQWYFLAQN